MVCSRNSKEASTSEVKGSRRVGDEDRPRVDSKTTQVL